MEGLASPGAQPMRAPKDPLRNATARRPNRVGAQPAASTRRLRLTRGSSDSNRSRKTRGASPRKAERNAPVETVITRYELEGDGLSALDKKKLSEK